MKLDKKSIEEHWKSTKSNYSSLPKIDYSEERLTTFATAVNRRSLQDDTYLQFTDFYFLNAEYNFISLEGLVNLIDTILVKIYTGKKNLLDLGGVFMRSIYSFQKSDDQSLEKDIDSNGIPPVLLYDFPKLEKVLVNQVHKFQYAILVWVIHKRHQHLASMSEDNKFKKHLSEFQKEFKVDVTRFLESKGIDPAVYDNAIEDLGKAYQDCLLQTQNADTLKLAFDFHEVVAAIYFKLRIIRLNHKEITEWLPNYLHTLVSNKWNTITAATEIKLEEQQQQKANDIIADVIKQIDRNKIKSESSNLSTLQKYLKATKSVSSHLGYFNSEKGFNTKKLLDITYPKLVKLSPHYTSKIKDEIDKFIKDPQSYLS